MTIPIFVAIDVETTLNGNEDVGLAHPMHPDNRVVLYGLTAHGGVPCVWEHGDSASAAIDSFLPETVFCGHNFSFDLLYLYKDSRMKDKLQAHKIWDTQLAEYILTGQRSKFSSLDELSKKYGLPLKDDKIKAYFQAGMGSDKIPREELEPYLKQDVENTVAIARIQYEAAVLTGQLTLIETQMEALHATTEMMFNGLHIDKATLDSYTVEVVNQFVEVKLTLEEKINPYVEDINSPKQWSQFFFGGTKKIKVKEEVGVYKNGKTKYKLMDKELKILPAIKYVPDPDKVSEKTGQVSVDDTVLNDMLRHTLDPKITGVIKALLEYRELSKQLSTYVQGLSKHLIGDFIHGKLNHTATVTGRLSSTCLPDTTVVHCKQGIDQLKYVQAGDEVLTHMGRFRKVLAKQFTGIKKTYKISLVNGACVTCTSDHRILTTQGWLTLEDIYVGMQETLERSCAGIKGDAASREHRVLLDGRHSGENGYYVPHNSFYSLEEPFYRAVLGKEVNDLLKEQNRHGEPDVWEVSRSAPQLQGRCSGEGWVHLSDTSKLVQGASKSETRISATACDVRSTGNRSSPGGMGGAPCGSGCNKQQHRQLGVANQLCSSAPTSGYSAIKRIDYVGTTRVYDLEVEEDHSFLADSVYVHNCPNLQNISNNPIKKIFTSRYDGGLIVEVDFNQLEVVALAHVTRDKQLIKDISVGTDIHSALYNQMFGRMPTKEERKPFKSRTFQLIYGAGAKAISKQAGCSLDEAKKFIEVFYNRYPSVASWHKNFATSVDHGAVYLMGDDGLKEKFRTYVHQTETGRKFVFKEYYSDSDWSSRMYNFSPTELKNYPIQGLATGDVVPLMLGVIFRKFKDMEGVKLVNTIHDSVMFDVTKEAAVEFILDIQEVFKDTDKYFREAFKVPLALKLNAGASFGVNWFDMEEIEKI